MRLDEREVHQLLYCASAVARERRERGAPPGAWLVRMIRRLELEAAVSGSGHELELRVPHSESWITAEQAAALLGMSARQAKRIANDLDGQIIGGRWLFPRCAVIEFAAARAGD